MSDNKKITDLTALGTTPAGTYLVPVVDTSGINATTKKVTITNLMAAAPVQTSDLGTAAATDTTAYATAAEGALAASATQPADLGTAAATDTTAYATAAEGALAASATQPADLGTAAALDSGILTGNVVVLDSTGLPAVDGSNLTNITSTSTDSTKLAITNNLSDLNDAATARTNLGLVPGVGIGQVIVADAVGLPAINGSQLTDVTATASPTRAFRTSSAATNGIGLASDAGKVLVFTHATGVAVTVNNGLGIGFTCDIIQGGAGPITMVAGAGVTLYGGASGASLQTEGENCMLTLTMLTGNLGYVTGQLAAPAAFTGVEWSNMTSNNLYFDDYQQNIYNMMGNASWGSTNYMYFDVSTLAGKWKKYTIADYYDSVNYVWTGAMWNDLHAALGTSNIGMSIFGNGTLGALNGNQIENSTNTPIYVWASTAGTTVTAVSAHDGYSAYQDFVPIIFGMDWDNMQGWENTLGSSPGPKWGMTLVMNVNGYLEETKDAYGQPYHNPIQPYAAYLYSTTTSNTFTGFSLTGNIGGGSSGTVTGGDQT